jgi:predicted ArsR family transcriptional regulator
MSHAASLWKKQTYAIYRYIRKERQVPRDSLDSKTVSADETSWHYLEALSEPRRRAVFDAVVDSATPVTRDEVAAACGISRELAAFHLDKLHDVGLLTVDFARPEGRTGPGAGRPAKRYRRAAVEVMVQLPPREYELAARILVAAAQATAEHDALPPAVAAAARDEGERIGRQRRLGSGRRGRRLGVAATWQTAREVLASLGYQPRDDRGTMRLSNCPFHALAQTDRALVCGLNVAFVDGVLAGIDGAPTVTADLEPGADRCCVALHQARTNHT